MRKTNKHETNKKVPVIIVLKLKLLPPFPLMDLPLHLNNQLKHAPSIISIL